MWILYFEVDFGFINRHLNYAYSSIIALFQLYSVVSTVLGSTRLRFPLLFDSDYYSKKPYSSLTSNVMHTAVACDNHI